MIWYEESNGVVAVVFQDRDKLNNEFGQNTKFYQDSARGKICCRFLVNVRSWIWGLGKSNLILVWARVVLGHSATQESLFSFGGWFFFFLVFSVSVLS